MQKNAISEVHNRVKTLPFSQLWTIISLLPVQSNVCAHRFKPPLSQAYRLSQEVEQVGIIITLRKRL